MDILKRIYVDSNSCKISKTNVTIQGKEIDGEQPVVFPTKTSKSYSLRSVLFLLLNPDKQLKDYLTLCKDNNVKPISYVDKASILQDIMSYEPETVNGFFIYPVYSDSSLNFEFPNIKENNVIVIPQCFSSKINIENIESLLIDGIYNIRPYNPRSEPTKQIILNGRSYNAITDYSSIVDFEQIKAVFIENLDSKDLQLFLKKCPKNIILLTFKNELFKSFKIEVSGSHVVNHKELINELTK